MDNNNVALITKMVLEAIEHQKASEENGYLVPVGVSARHIHLTQEHVEALFGEGYQLTKRKELMGGQFASNETVTIVGLKLRAIENVRILGPVRSRSQVEVSATDALRLGVKAPIRESGNVEGSAAIAVVGPNAADSTMLWANYNGFPTKTVTIVEGIRNKVPNAEVIYELGCNHTADLS
mgnify:CR=1 FL=1